MKLNLGQPELNYNSNILDINIPKEMEHAIPTGHRYIDKLFAGDGMIAGTVALVTGDPGAGKSTLMQDLADKLTGSGHVALYVTGEESVYQLRRVAKRLRLNNGFIVSHNTEAEEIIAHVEMLKNAPENTGKKVFLIIDSLPCLRLSPPNKTPGVNGHKVKRGRPLSDGKQADLALQMITTYAKNNWVPVLLIGHVTKNGRAAGKNTVKHIVDCHLHLSIDTDPDTGMEYRSLEMLKNRFGPTGISFDAEMGEHGLEFIDNSNSNNESNIDSIDIDIEDYSIQSDNNIDIPRRIPMFRAA